MMIAMALAGLPATEISPQSQSLGYVPTTDILLRLDMICTLMTRQHGRRPTDEAPGGLRQVTLI
jgi:hypothetical protein